MRARSLLASTVLGLAWLPLVLPAQSAAAQTAASGEDLPRIRITDPNRALLPLALPNVVGDPGLAAEGQEIERRSLAIIGLFNVLNPASFPPDLQRERMGFSSALWSQVGAQGVAKLQVSRQGPSISVEGRLYQVGRGEAPVMEKSYRGPALRPLVHQWVNDIIAQFTGTRGIFGSRIAYAMTGRGNEIGTVGADGGDNKVLTKMGHESLMPAYSPDGSHIAFTSYLRGTPDLWIVPSQGGRARAVSKKPGMNSGAVWVPGGRELILTLSFEGNAELYRISAQDGRVLDRLTRNPFIDMSATLSPDGTQIAFVSDRGGSAQIYVMPTSGGQPRRITFQGGNNTTPKWRPRQDKPQIAFTGRDERGAFDIFVHDLGTQKIERITQNQGSNQSPDWSPDGRLLVYASSRGGLFVTNPETHKETQILEGQGELAQLGASAPTVSRAGRQAAIDIGTNTTLLLVGEPIEGHPPEDVRTDGQPSCRVRVLTERAEITRLGRGIGRDGRLGAEGIERTLRVLEDYAAVARAAGAKVAAVGTEGLRRACNAQEFLEPAERILGVPVEVISGDREAALTFRAAVTSFPELAARPLMVIDIGGGSTEVIQSDQGVVRWRSSLPLGSVRMTERYIQHDPPTAAECAVLSGVLDQALASLPKDRQASAPPRLVGTAGTVTTLAAMALGLADYDAARVHGYELSATELEAQVARLASSSQAERETMVGLDPRRADVIYAGACILRAFMHRLGAPSVLVNDRGIRWGLLYERMTEAHPA